MSYCYAVSETDTLPGHVLFGQVPKPVLYVLLHSALWESFTKINHPIRGVELSEPDGSLIFHMNEKAVQMLRTTCQH